MIDWDEKLMGGRAAMSLSLSLGKDNMSSENLGTGECWTLNQNIPNISYLWEDIIQSG